MSDDPGSASERLLRAACAARELTDALWDSLQHELSQASSERARALARRLGEVSSTVALLLEGASVAPAPISEPAREGDGQTALRSSERRTPPDPIPTPSASFAPGAREPARLVDEQEPARVMPFSAVARGESVAEEISIHDVRREEGPAAWISSVGRMLVRHGEDRLPFAVLLVEIVDVAHLERSETPHDLHGIVAQVESALGRGMRASDELSRETLGRYWLLAPETNGTGARMLAERLAGLVRGSATHRGVPMEVAIGIAICPEDGTDAPALAARADLGVYSARATGRSVSHSEPPGR
ncbi:MAG TPA: hypothetical protein VFW38_04780 [Solirubrobacteraceae bacterium]|nr:hypothetical protein [Solirubrobacteraceae bacterium]